MASIDPASIFSTGPFAQRKRMLRVGFPHDDAPEATDRHGRTGSVRIVVEALRAEEALSQDYCYELTLLADSAGIAAKDMLDIRLEAKQVVINARESVVVNGGTSFTQWDASGIVHGTPGLWREQAARHVLAGPASRPTDASLPGASYQGCTAAAQQATSDQAGSVSLD